MLKEKEERLAKQRQLMEDAVKKKRDAKMHEWSSFVSKNPTDDKANEAKFYEIFAKDDAEMLSHFDKDGNYGPAVGLSRRERYAVAIKLGLAPPECIVKLMDKYPKESDIKHTNDLS